MASLFTRCESIRLFLLGFCKNEVYQGRAGDPFSSEEELKTKKKLYGKTVQQLWNHYEKQLNSLSLDHEQLKKNGDIVSKWYLVDWIIYNGIVKL